MNYKIAFTAVAIALFTFACSDHAEHDGHADAAAHAAMDHDHGEDENAEAHEGDGSTTVSLDNGQRWEANPETTSGIAKMVSLIDGQTATPGDPEALKASLETEFKLIFERCTMTGESHNQLHNYLIPLHQRLNVLDAGDATQLAEMKSYLATYDNYFD